MKQQSKDKTLKGTCNQNWPLAPTSGHFAIMVYIIFMTLIPAMTVNSITLYMTIFIARITLVSAWRAEGLRMSFVFKTRTINYQGGSCESRAWKTQLSLSTSPYVGGHIASMCPCFMWLWPQSSPPQNATYIRAAIPHACPPVCPPLHHLDLDRYRSLMRPSSSQ